MDKVIIIGGGIGGLTLARACIDVGIPVEVYEKRSQSEMLSGAGGIFIQRNAMKVYQLLWGGKLYDRCYQQGGAILDGGFLSKRGKLLYLNSPKFIKEENLGICLLRSKLQQILYESLPSGTVKNGYIFENFAESTDSVQASFQNGTITEGRIIVGADGLYSLVKARIQGKERLEPPIYSGTCCWRGNFEGKGLPLDQRYSWGEYWGQGDRFGYFDVGAGRYSFYAFANTPAGGTDAAEGGAIQALRSRFSGYANPVPAILDAISHEPIYRDDIYDREPWGHTWGQGRVTLIGDAAHAVQPSIGQGGCMAIEDAFELAKKLTQLAKVQSTSALLRQFEASRSDRVTRVFTTARQVGQLGQTDNAIACYLRNLIYQMTPTWLADLQFKWLFDYNPDWNDSP